MAIAKTLSPVGATSTAAMTIRRVWAPPVIAAATGIVTYRGRLGNYGNAVQLLHGQGVSTLYGHLSKIDVDRWQYVNRGETIGAVGSTGRSTGSHLHTNCA